METANVNRDGEQVAAHIKASELDVHSKPQLSRREREAIEKERKRKNYQEAYAQVLFPPPTLFGPPGLLSRFPLNSTI